MRYLFPCFSVLALSLLLPGCSSVSSNPIMPTLQHLVPQSGDSERSHFDSRFHFLRVTVDDNVLFMASDTLNLDSVSTVGVWYSAEREVLRFQNGRLLAAVGLASEWRRVVLPELPAWSELALLRQPVSWVRMRDVMPGYRLGVRDVLLVQPVSPPSDSRLKGIDPGALTWFEEHFDMQKVARSADVLPRARYAVDFSGSQEVVVYGEQCISSEICLTWQRWPVETRVNK